MSKLIIRVEELVAMGASRTGALRFHRQLLEGMERFGILESKERAAHFLGQLLHESGGLRYVEENLNYSAEGLMRVFPKYFPTRGLAEKYAKKPMAIASLVYANRMGNGAPASMDGWTFRGRGLKQLTGRDNYKAFGDWLGKDVVKNPDMVATDYAALSAVWFWDANGLNAVADRGSVLQVTREVNGGLNGLEEREKLTAKARQIIRETRAA